MQMEIPGNLSGLQGAQAGPQTAPGALLSDSPPPPEGPATASPEEQALYETFVGNAAKVLFNKKALAKTVDALKTEDPMEGVARVTAMVVVRVAQEAARQGKPLPMDVLMHGAQEIFGEVVSLAEEAGVHEFSKDPDMVQGAMVRAFDEMRTGLSDAGLIDQQQMQADLQELQAADQSGELARFMQGAQSAPPASAPSRGLGV